jgi:hypothetical protein
VNSSCTLIESRSSFPKTARSPCACRARCPYGEAQLIVLTERSDPRVPPSTSRCGSTRGFGHCRRLRQSLSKFCAERSCPNECTNHPNSDAPLRRRRDHACRSCAVRLVLPRVGSVTTVPLAAWCPAGRAALWRGQDHQITSVDGNLGGRTDRGVDVSRGPARCVGGSQNLAPR